MVWIVAYYNFEMQIYHLAGGRPFLSLSCCYNAIKMIRKYVIVLTSLMVLFSCRVPLKTGLVHENERKILVLS